MDEREAKGARSTVSSRHAYREPCRVSSCSAGQDNAQQHIPVSHALMLFLSLYTRYQHTVHDARYLLQVVASLILAGKGNEKER